MKKTKRIISFLTFLFLFSNFITFFPIQKIQASSGSGTFAQSDWSGGDGQTNFSDVTKYKEEGGDGIYPTENVRMKIDADKVVGQSDLERNIQNGATLGEEDLNYPLGVYSDGTKFLVADSGNNRILVYNSIPITNNATPDVVIGQQDFITNSSGTSATKMNYPVGVYFDGTRLFVADRGNNRVLIYNSIPTANGAAADVVIGQTNFITNSSGTSATKIDYPTGVYSDGTKLFVADRNNHRILIYNSIPTANGAAADVVVGQPDFVTNSAGTSATKMDYPKAVYSDGTKLFVVDEYNHRVLIYNSIPTTNGAAAAVVVGQANFTTGTSGTSATKMYGPQSVHSNGTKLFVVDKNNHRVLIYNSIPTTNGAAADVVVGQPDFTTSSFGTSSTKMMYPQSVYFDGTHLFVADRSNNRVLIYNSIPTINGKAADVVVGQTDFTHGSANQGIGADATDSGVSLPTGTYFDGTYLFIADSDNNRVLIYNSIPTENGAAADVVVGQPDFVTNSAGTSATKMDYPKAVYSDGTKLFVVDEYNRRVLIYNSIPTENGAAADVVVGQPDFVTNSAGTSATKIYIPGDVFFDGTRLFVIDQGNNRVLIYNSIPTVNGTAADVVIGQTDFVTGSGGTSATKLYPYVGIYSDGTRLILSDEWNSRVLIYNSIPTENGAAADVVIGQTDFNSDAYGESKTELDCPGGVSFDGTRLFVLDASNYRILVYNSIPTANGAAADEVIGQADFSNDTWGSGIYKIDWTEGQMFANNQFMLVADTYNHRVLLFSKTAASSTLISSIYQTDQTKDWGPISWDVDNTSYSGVRVEIMTDQSKTWSEVTNGQEFIGRGKTIKYRLTLFNVDGLSSPTFNSISIGYKNKSDEDLRDIRLSFENAKQKLDNNQKTYTKDQDNAFQGQDDKLKNGEVKIYKNNKRIKTIDADKDGNWKVKLKIKDQKTNTLKFKFFDQYGVELYSNKYDLKVDSERPMFKVLFPKTLNKNDKIQFTAEDNDQIDYYKIKLLDKQGHILRSKKQQKDFCYIPEVILTQSTALIVRAYDKAGNYQEQKADLAEVKLAVIQPTREVQGVETQNVSTETNSEHVNSKDMKNQDLNPQVSTENLQPKIQKKETKKFHWWNPFDWF